MTKYTDDNINGKLVPPLVVASDYVLAETHSGTVHVEAGTFWLRGTLRGTLDIQSDVTAIIEGHQHGTVNIARDAVVTVSGQIRATVNVQAGGELIIEGSGRLGGTLCNNGLVILRGVFGGAQTGAGQLKLEEHGHIKQPVFRDGIHYYEW